MVGRKHAQLTADKTHQRVERKGHPLVLEDGGQREKDSAEHARKTAAQNSEKNNGFES